MKNSNADVYDALNEAGLVNNEYDKDHMIETGQIFTKCHSISEIIKVIEKTGLDSEISTNGEHFSAFINGILFNVCEWK